jgi:fumarylpyruvate hydrolase
MTAYVVPPPDLRDLPVRGTRATFPVNRVFCVARNYAEHAREMGSEVDREAPFYFTKSVAHVVPSGVTVGYPPGTADYHHEMELVIALGAPAFCAGDDEARSAIFGYASGLDMTRRDLQGQAKEKRRPWDTGKDVESSAVVGEIVPMSEFGDVGPQRIWLSVNGAIRQDARLSDMIWSVPEIVRHLSTLYHLAPGDLIFTGTPAGVGPVLRGDHVQGGIDGLPDVELHIGRAA